MRVVILLVLALAACGEPSGVTGSIQATGGNDRCHDEDGDAIWFRVDAYEAGLYAGYPNSADVALVNNVRVECDDTAFELELPSGRYDISLIAYQEVILSSFEDEVIVPDVIVDEGAFTSLGTITLDVNDDDE